MSAGTLDIDLEQGVTWDYTLTVYEYDEDNPPTYEGDIRPLTGYTARAQIRKKKSTADYQIDLTTENGGITLGGALGTIDLHITAEQAEDLTSSGLWDLELVITIDGEETVERLVEGTVTLSKEVTREE